MQIHTPGHRPAISTSDVARVLGVPTRLVKQWESGEKEMLLTPTQAHKLCNLYRVTPRELAAMCSQEKADPELLLTPSQFHNLCNSFAITSEQFANLYSSWAR